MGREKSTSWSVLTYRLVQNNGGIFFEETHFMMDFRLCLARVANSPGVAADPGKWGVFPCGCES